MAKKTLTDEIDEATAFPIMVSDGLPWTAGGQAPGAAAPPSDLGSSALAAIKNVLGWAYRPGADPKALVSALNQSFKALPRQGRVDYQYVARNYSVAIQADLGTISGAQKSLYTRAKATLDQMLVLLADLKPLLPDPDISEIEAIRSLVRSEINDVVLQLGADGGPNVQLVDEAFTFLGGPKWGVDDQTEQGTALNFRNVGGHLGSIRRGFGLHDRWVNTIDEEQNMTNFIVLVDYVNSLYLSWKANRKFFDGTEAHAFMGTSLVQVSRALAVVAETVDEVRYVASTVFLGAPELQTLKLTYGSKAPIFLGDLLDWVRRFATEEGRQIINESGKDGVVTFTRTAAQLKELVDGALNQPADDKRIPKGFKTKRVQDAIANLAQQLGTAIEEAQNIKRNPPPVILRYEIEGSSRGGLKVEVDGREISDDAIVKLGFSLVTEPSPSAAAVDANAVTASHTHVGMSAYVRARFDTLDEINRRWGRDKAAKAVYLLIKNDDGQIAMTKIDGAYLMAVM
jgi:hypothetical protein